MAPQELSEWDKHAIKIAAAKASPSTVSIISHNVPVDMTPSFRGYTELRPESLQPKEIIFTGCGIIIECQISADAQYYLCTILAPACLFHRTGDVSPDQIEIDVFLWTGVMHKAKLLACDFHYNLAAVTINSDIPLPTLTLKSINDIVSIDPAAPLHLPWDTSFQLRPHSNLFNISPGSQLFSVYRFPTHPYATLPASGTFRTSSPEGLSCKELYEIKDSTYLGNDGGPLINSFGDAIGIIFNKSSFLPSNLVSRWWNHYKASGGFRRPFLGMDVANIHDADYDFLAQFRTTFPDISTAVIVTKVTEASPACRSGIRTNDVIIKLDSKLVRSKLEFYETIWEKAGKAVVVNVLRVINGQELKPSLVIEEASPNKFHQWPHPNWRKLW